MTIAKIEFEERESPYELNVFLVAEDKRKQVGRYNDYSSSSIFNAVSNITSELDSIEFRGDIEIDPRASPSRMLSSESIVQSLKAHLSECYVAGKINIDNIFMENI